MTWVPSDNLHMPSSFSLCIIFFFFNWSTVDLGFPGGSDSKESACSAGELVSIPRLRRFPGEKNGNPLQNSCLVGPIPWGRKESDLIEWLTLSLHFQREHILRSWELQGLGRVQSCHFTERKWKWRAIQLPLQGHVVRQFTIIRALLTTSTLGRKMLS